MRCDLLPHIAQLPRRAPVAETSAVMAGAVAVAAAIVMRAVVAAIAVVAGAVVAAFAATLVRNDNDAEAWHAGFRFAGILKVQHLINRDALG